MRMIESCVKSSGPCGNQIVDISKVNNLLLIPFQLFLASARYFAEKNQLLTINSHSSSASPPLFLSFFLSFPHSFLFHVEKGTKLNEPAAAHFLSLWLTQANKVVNLGI